MQVILTQNIKNLGKIGDCVNVKPGHARHLLFPKGMALPSSKENLERLEKRRAELEKAAEARLAQAKTRAEAINQLEVTIRARVASEDKLYGSVSVADIVAAAKEKNCPIEPSEIQMPKEAIRHLGDYTIVLQLNEEVTASLSIKVVPQAA